MFYPQEVIDRVIEANNIVDVIGEYVKLTKKGNTYFGLCPFHNEKTPSFSVTDNGSRQMYYCYGCHKGGSVLTFLMKYENYTYTEALKALAKRAGISLPEPTYAESKEAGQRAKQREDVLNANKEAALYFYRLLKTENGTRAYEYLKNRGLADETIKNFGLGYADKYRDDLYKYLKSKNIPDEIINITHLATIKEKDTYDFFWNRVMFPIMDTRNHVIGFGGRVLGDGEPKYINTPETVVFEKNRNLFGLNYAKRHKGEPFILCEGNMDVISMHQAGFTNAVASLGTSLTAGQASLLKRYTDNVYIAYDADKAGRNAALRAIGILREAGISVKVIDHSPYKDPDDVIKGEGREGYEKRIKKAVNGLIFEIYMLRETYNMDDLDDKTAFYNETAKKISYLSDDFERENYLQAISKIFAIDYAMLKSRARELALSHDKIKHFVPEKVQAKKKTTADDALDKCEQIVLSYMVQDPPFFGKVKEILSADDFVLEPYDTIAPVLFGQLEAGKVNIVSILNMFDDADMQESITEKLSFSFDGMDGPEREKAITDSIIRIKRQAIDDRLKNETDARKIGELFKEKDSLGNLIIFRRD